MADDTDIATIGIAVDSSQVDASTAALQRWTAAGAEAEAMLARLTAANAAAFKGVSPAMAAAAGPSPVGGSVASPFGPQWQAGVTSATTSMSSLDAAVKAATSALAALAHYRAPPGGALPMPSGAHPPALPGGAPPSLPRPPAAPASDAAERAADALRDRLDPQAQAHRQMSEAVGRYGDLLKSGHLSQAEFTAGVKLEQDALSKAAGGMAAYEREADALRAKLDPLAAAHMRMSDQVARYGELLAKGHITQTEYAGAAKAAGHEFEEIEKRLKHGGGLGHTQMQELQHVGKAVFDEFMATGQIMRPLMMESGRLMDVLGGGKGGLAGGLAMVKSGLLALANPAVIAAAAFGVVGVAALSYESSQERLQRAVEGRGRATGLTASGLRDIADQAAAAGNMRGGEARGVVSSYAQAGLSPDLIGGLGALTPRYARFAGMENGEAAEKLADVFRDPVEGAKALDKQFGNLNDRVLETLEAMKASGDIEGARKLEMEEFTKALKATTDSTWLLGDTMREVKRWSGSLIDGVGAGLNSILGGDRSPEDRLKSYQDMLPHTFDAPAALGNLSRSYVQDQIDRLQKEIARRADPGRDARDARANELSLQAGPIIRSLLPEIVKAEKAEQNLALFRTVLSDPATMAALKLPRDDVERAYDRLRVTSANADPDRRTRQDYDIRMSGIGEMDAQDRALNEARKAELAVLRQTGDVVRAATAAQMSLNEAIQASNVDAAEKLRLERQQGNLIGLTGLARTIQEIRNQFDGPNGEIERNRFDKGGTSVLADDAIRKDLQGAGEKLAAAIEGGGPKVEAAGGGLAKIIEQTGDHLSEAGTKLVAAVADLGTKVAAAPAPSPFGTLDRGAFGTAMGGTGRTGQPMFALMDRAIAAGADPATAAGFAAGTSMESGTQLSPTADNGSHLGVAQWDGPRWRALVAKLGGARMSTQPGQFDGIFAELGTSEAGAGRRLLAGHSVLDGIMASDAYEREGDVEAARRRGEALSRGNALLKAYQGRAAEPGVMTLPTIDVEAKPLTVHAKLPTEGPMPPVRPIASTSAADTTALRDTKIEQATQSARLGLLQNGGQQVVDLTEQIRLQGATFGQTAGKVAELTAESRLLAEAQRGMISLSPTLRASIHEEAVTIGQKTEQLQAQAELQRTVQGFEDTVRGGLSGAVSAGLTSAAHGKGFGEAFRNGLSSLGDRLISQGTNDLFASVLGQQGKGIGSGGGGILSSLMAMLPGFAGGTDDALGGPTIVGESGPELVTMPKGAQILTADETSHGSAKTGTAARTPMPPVVVQIMPVGGAQFTPEQIREIRGHVANGVADGHAQIQRNYPGFQADTRQY